MPVQVGESVSSGQVLAALSARDAQAAVDQASAAVAAAQAAYQKVEDGATSEQVSVAQTALANATAAQVQSAAQQTQSVKSAYSAMLNVAPAAIAGPLNNDGVTATITGTYTGIDQGTYSVVIYQTGNGPEFQTSGLEASSGLVRNVPVALGARGLFIQFSGTPSTADTFTVNIPNTAAPGYVAASSAYQAALQAQSQAAVAAQSAVAQAQANLSMTETPAQPEDLAAAQAQIQVAQANLEAAESADSKTQITAPFDGTVTEVDAKVGQTASPGTPEIGLISHQNFQAVMYLSQPDLGKVNVGDSAQITLDAYGSSVVFPATVAAIDPSATTVSGVPGYKVTLQFTDDDSRIKDGLAANITVTDATHANVLAIPASAVFTLAGSGGSAVLEQDSSGKVTQVPVQLGFAGLNGTVEVTSGLGQGDSVIYFGK